MKELFPEYYGNKAEPEWNSAIFAFDANVLLNLYGYTKKTADGWIEGLERIKDRIFLPYQAAKEYHRNLESKREQILEQAAKPFLKPFDEIKNSLAEKPPKMNPLRDFEGFEKSCELILEEAAKHKESTRKHIDEWKTSYAAHCEDIKEKLATVFSDSRLGRPPSRDDVVQWCIDGKSRYAQNIAPGFKDADKKDGNPFGDLFIWYELLSLARSDAKDIVFVTFEKKPDWVDLQGKSVTALKELKLEFISVTGQSFDAVTADRFFYWLDKQTGTENKEAKQEVDEAVARAGDDDLNRRQSIGDDILELLAGLTPRERDLLRLRFGLDDGVSRTQEQVAQLFGVDVQRIANIEAKGLRKLRQPGGPRARRLSEKEIDSAIQQTLNLENKNESDKQ